MRDRRTFAQIGYEDSVARAPKISRHGITVLALLTLLLLCLFFLFSFADDAVALAREEHYVRDALEENMCDIDETALHNRTPTVQRVAKESDDRVPRYAAARLVGSWAPILTFGPIVSLKVVAVEKALPSGARVFAQFEHVLRGRGKWIARVVEP